MALRQRPVGPVAPAWIKRHRLAIVGQLRLRSDELAPHNQARPGCHRGGGQPDAKPDHMGELVNGRREEIGLRRLEIVGAFPEVPVGVGVVEADRTAPGPEIGRCRAQAPDLAPRRDEVEPGGDARGVEPTRPPVGLLGARQVPATNVNNQCIRRHHQVRDRLDGPRGGVVELGRPAVARGRLDGQQGILECPTKIVRRPLHRRATFRGVKEAGDVVIVTDVDRNAQNDTTFQLKHGRSQGTTPPSVSSAPSTTPRPIDPAS